MTNRLPRPAAVLSPLVPYAAVLAGLYGLHSGAWALAFYHLAMLAYLATPPGRTAVAGLARGRLTPFGAVLVAGGALLGPLFVLLAPHLVPAGGPSYRELLAGAGLGGRVTWTVFAAYYGLVHPAVEEAYWRGLVAPASRHAWWTDVAFGGYHALVLVRFVAWPWAVGLAIMAAAWRAAARASGGLRIPWLAHLGGDLGFVLALAWLARA